MLLTGWPTYAPYSLMMFGWLTRDRCLISAQNESLSLYVSVSLTATSIPDHSARNTAPYVPRPII